MKQPYDETKVTKMANGVVKVNEHDGTVLACRQHPLLGYVLSTYRQEGPEGKPVQRQYFYNREDAFENFAARSGLVDERKLFNETQMRFLHAGLVKLRIQDGEFSEEDLKEIGKLVDRLENLMPELHREEKLFDFKRLLDTFSLGNGTER